MSIGRVCTRRMATLEPHGSLEEAAALMARLGVDTVVVLDQDGEALGVVTDRDLVVRGMARGLSPRETRVSEIMTSPLPAELQVRVLALENHGAPVRSSVALRDAYETLPSLLALDDALHMLDRELGRRSGRDDGSRDDGNEDGHSMDGGAGSHDGDLDGPRGPWRQQPGPSEQADGLAVPRTSRADEEAHGHETGPRPRGRNGGPERRRRPRTRPWSPEATRWE